MINLFLKIARSEAPSYLIKYKKPGQEARKLVTETVEEGISRFINDYIIYTGKRDDFIIKEEITKNFRSNYESRNLKEINKTDGILKCLFTESFKKKYNLTEEELSGRKRF
ncbi:hypothetical protein GVAV_000933 [Gurleya vavrai]